MQARRLPKLKAWMKQECCSPRVRTPHTVRLLLAYVPIGCLYTRDLCVYSASRYVNMYVYAVHVARFPFFVLRCNYLVRDLRCLRTNSFKNLMHVLTINICGRIFFFIWTARKDMMYYSITMELFVAIIILCYIILFFNLYIEQNVYDFS